MNRKSNQKERRRGLTLFLSIVLVFCILGAVVHQVARRITREMSASAIQNLSETLGLRTNRRLSASMIYRDACLL